MKFMGNLELVQNQWCESSLCGPQDVHEVRTAPPATDCHTQGPQWKVLDLHKGAPCSPRTHTFHQSPLTTGVLQGSNTFYHSFRSHEPLEVPPPIRQASAPEGSSTVH